MDAQKRRREIARLTLINGSMPVEKLAETLNVTASTIRRDLAHLTASGELIRTYGGVSHPAASGELSLQERSGEAHRAKKSIGAWCAQQIRNGESILLDAGTTTTEIAKAIVLHKDLTVVSPGLTPIEALQGAPQIDVISLGGQLRRTSQAFVGSLSELILERLSFDRAFLGADALRADLGICEATPEQTCLKEAMCKRAARIYVVAHAEKIGQTPFPFWAPFPDSWTLVTDSSASEAVLAPFWERGVEVIVV